MRNVYIPHNICNQFMKERSLSNVTFVLLVAFYTNANIFTFLIKVFIHFTLLIIFLCICMMVLKEINLYIVVKMRLLDNLSK